MSIRYIMFVLMLISCTTAMCNVMNIYIREQMFVQR